ncbi:hypothetical protein GF325_19075 [Candidatus Bathyarchaeota archaeon]|nr:hypothetical protein [Candidatus Bathyarchaeota archaeon]
MNETEDYVDYLDSVKHARGIRKDGNLTIVRYDIINFQQFLDLKDSGDVEKGLVVVPVSPIEVHGKYLPLSADYIETFLALDMLKDALKNQRSDNQYTIFELPGIPIGTGTNRGHWATLHTNRKAFYDVLVNLFESLVYSGFRKIFVMSVHHGMIHAYAMEQAANKVMKQNKDLDVRILSPNHFIADTLFIQDPVKVFSKYIEKHGQEPLSDHEKEALNHDHHAGIMEITFTKMISEKLVDPSYKEAPRNVEDMGAQLKGLISRKWAAHPPLEPDGCGYNAEPGLADSRNWEVLFTDMIKDIGLSYVDALYAEDRKAMEPYINMNPWKGYSKGLEIARRMFLGVHSKRNHLIIPFVLVAIAIPWILYILEILR